MNHVTCSGCGKNYLEHGLIEVIDRGEMYTISIRDYETPISITLTVAPGTNVIKGLGDLDGPGYFCVGCLGPLVVMATGKALNLMQIQGFHAKECEGECNP